MQERHGKLRLYVNFILTVMVLHEGLKRLFNLTQTWVLRLLDEGSSLPGLAGFTQAISIEKTTEFDQ